VIAALVEPFAIVIEALTVALVIVHDVKVVGVDLEAPDGHGVVDADVPRSMDGQVSVDWHVADAALLLGPIAPSPLRQPQDHVGIALAGPRRALSRSTTARSNQINLCPCSSVFVLIADAAERERLGYRVERSLGDRDLDHRGSTVVVPIPSQRLKGWQAWCMLRSRRDASDVTLNVTECQVTNVSRRRKGSGLSDADPP
jgi:hypothetical protein